jgi:hypothetical protein
MDENGNFIGLAARFSRVGYIHSVFRVNEENTWTGNTGGSHDN